MRRTIVILMSLFAMMMAGIGLKAQEITITLVPGWNWVSYPNTEVMDIASALGDFVPMEGDMIKSQFSNSTFTRGHWTGGITQFMPGLGYKYYSARTENIEFAFVRASSSNVMTSAPTNITATSAVVGGTVSVPEGGHVFLRGVCWGRVSNPDIDGNHTSEGTGVGVFSCTIEGLTPGTIYNVRAYAVTDNGLSYGDEQSFITLESGDYTYVDLGLPSGNLWATCNVGADAPEDYGDYFAWAETQPKDYYGWNNYLYSNGSSNTLTKYCNKANFGYNGYTDSLTILLPEDDAASINWGAEWRTPTYDEWMELRNNTSRTWTTQNGVNGMLFTAANGNSIFLPAAGSRYESNHSSTGTYGYYWQSLLGSPYPSNACVIYFYGNSGSIYSDSYFSRVCGLSVRPVRSAPNLITYDINVSVNPSEGGLVIGGGTYQFGTQCTLTATANEGYTFAYWAENGIIISTEASYTIIVKGNRSLEAYFTVSSSGDHEYVDLGLPSGTLWATCNIGANVPENYGDYFAWGETQPNKDYYEWSTYQYCNGSNTTMTKYCDNPSYGYNGFTDNLTTLLPEDDAAMVNWGPDWRMPTKEEWHELLDNTSCRFKTQNGVKGYLFTAQNGNTLFLPASGVFWQDDLISPGYNGLYWSSSLSASRPDIALYLSFLNTIIHVSSTERLYGISVRAVRSSAQN